MTISIHQPRYWPWLGFIHKIAQSDLFVFLDTVQFNKQSYQQRCQIRTKEGWTWLTIPVLTSGKSQQRIQEVEIANEHTWKRKHYHLIKNNYSNAQHFDIYEDEIREIYARNWKKLVDLNIYTTKKLLAWLRIDTELIKASEINPKGKKTELNLNICKALGADVYLSGTGAKDYLDTQQFDRQGIKVKWQSFDHPTYQQRWPGFEKGMSALDLILNHGDNSKKILLGDSGGENPSLC